MDDANNTETRTSEESIDGHGRETSRRTFLSASAVGLTGAGIAAASTGAAADSDSDDGEDDEYDEDGEMKPFATVEFSNQLADRTTVVVDQVVMSTSGFVAIHDARLFEGEPLESVIGVSEYLDAGAHYAVEIDLFDVPGADFGDESQVLGEGQPLVAMPHRNVNRDTTYEFVSSDGELDGPFTDDGFPVVDLGFAGVDAGKVIRFALVDFENQRTDGKEITLDEVVLSEGGFVAIHDTRLLEGKPFESVVGVSEYLEAGEHYDVEVKLFDDVPGAEFDDDELSADQPLFPMPHRDTNGNETYDFVSSGGSEDGPFTDNGQAVVDFGFVTLKDEKEDKEKKDKKNEKKDSEDGDGGT